MYELKQRTCAVHYHPISEVRSSGYVTIGVCLRVGGAFMNGDIQRHKGRGVTRQDALVKAHFRLSLPSPKRLSRGQLCRGTTPGFSAP